MMTTESTHAPSTEKTQCLHEEEVQAQAMGDPDPTMICTRCGRQRPSDDTIRREVLALVEYGARMGFGGPGFLIRAPMSWRHAVERVVADMPDVMVDETDAPGTTLMVPIEPETSTHSKGVRGRHDE